MIFDENGCLYHEMIRSGLLMIVKMFVETKVNQGFKTSLQEKQKKIVNTGWC